MSSSRSHIAFSSLSSLQLVATGLDGTLLRSDLTLSPYTRTVLQNLQAVGVPIVLMSARPPRTLRQFALAANIRGIAICSNGAIVYDLDEERIVQEYKLTPEHIQELIHHLHHIQPHLTFAVETGTFLACETAFYTSCAPPDACLPSIVDRHILWQQPQIKIQVHHPNIKAPELYKQLEPFIEKDLYSLTYSSSQFLEIALARVQKGRALAELCHQWGIPAHSVVAFGNMPNDIPMLQWAGLSLALANAHPLVQQAAQTIPLSNDEDGCASILEELIPRASRNRICEVPHR
ncbi:Cof-type HAD-IIB family hydrolase [Ktedonospora formicarum]|uniref:Hydrolase n=1 Tax=Ktedonospora formicarum TaxID=2778364 RepID=A0A8J3HRU1_9CHLR|nr:Cof-type HAD-IIB family hydrolase [Ktedonospora formicarum]GHO42111.1 hydrolase [Ktedonospora formicarum]